MRVSSFLYGRLGTRLSPALDGLNRHLKRRRPTLAETARRPETARPAGTCRRRLHDPHGPAKASWRDAATSTRSTATASCAWPSARRASRSRRRSSTRAQTLSWRGRPRPSARRSRSSRSSGLSAYSNEDLFQQDALLDASLDGARARWRTASRDLPIAAGRRPAAARSRAGSSTARLVLHRGRVLGVVPKSYLPNYREFYEKRQFAAARAGRLDARCDCSAHDVPVRQPSCCSRRATSTASCCTSRSARTSGCRCRRARWPRWPARRCSPTSRPATSRSARPTIAA